ncbi:MAG: 6-bladed beta-propeller [Geobacter sp.]|nr:6-bladed beta-propeller [Geobacter sp.]
MVISETLFTWDNCDYRFKPYKPVNRLLKISAFLLIAALFCGCAETTVSRGRYFWPPPPERPRLEWIGAYSSQLDLPMTTKRKMKWVLVGEDSPITFASPMDIKSDGNGRVFVSDPGKSSVFIYDMKQNEVRILPRQSDEIRFHQPISVALDDEGKLYIADSWLKIVLVYDSREEFRGIINIKGHVKKISAIAVDRARKRLLVADIGEHKIKVFNLSGEFQFEFGGQGEGDGEFSYPMALAVNLAGEVVVADSMNARVQIFDGNGLFLRKFGSRGSGVGDFQLIKGVATDSDNNIYVTDGRTHRVLVFSATGEFLLPVGGLYSIASRKLAPGGFVLPQGIDVDRNDTIYVVDQMNKRFQVFQYLTEKYLGEHPVQEKLRP